MVLKHISASIDSGQLVALVGPSGAGKSTIASLIPRLYDVTSGAIRIDGIDVRAVTQESLRSAIGVVAQDPHLFHDTVIANLRYAKPDATDAEVEAACRAAQIHNVIAALPRGYDTLVGERGYRLSGGEKQRLAIARMLLKDPRIVVLDEATSHLDSENEHLVQDALLANAALVGAHGTRDRPPAVDHHDRRSDPRDRGRAHRRARPPRRAARPGRPLRRPVPHARPRRCHAHRHRVEESETPGPERPAARSAARAGDMGLTSRRRRLAATSPRTGVERLAVSSAAAEMLPYLAVVQEACFEEKAHVHRRRAQRRHRRRSAADVPGRRVGPRRGARPVTAVVGSRVLRPVRRRLHHPRLVVGE